MILPSVCVYNICVCTVEDTKLNSLVFLWPEHIKSVFELSQSRIVNKRDHIEDELRKRTQAYEEKLNDMVKEVESFRRKEVCLKIRNSFEQLFFLQEHNSTKMLLFNSAMLHFKSTSNF